MDASGPDPKKLRGDGSSGNGTAAPPTIYGTDCRRYYTPEGCPFGDSCRYRHPTSAWSGAGRDFSFGVANRSKPCLKFFSTCGCPYGEGCHFSHYLPGGLPALALSGFGAFGAGNLLGGLGLAGLAPSSFLPADPSANLGGYKTRLCNRYSGPEGCRFGDKCHFAHGEKELRKANGALSNSDLKGLSSLDASRDPSASFSQALAGGFTGVDANLGNVRESGVRNREPTPPGMAAAGSFGASSTAKICIDASLAGAIIGKGGINAKQISQLTGAKLSIREHESDPNLRNVEMEGSFDQINLANQMVREILMHKDILPPKSAGNGSHNYKTKKCENYAQGTCTFGDRCHFAHGDVELNESSAQA